MMNAFHKLLQAEVWECFNSDGVSVVSIDVGDADRASHRFFLNYFQTANSHLCWCELAATGLSKPSVTLPNCSE